MLINNSLTHRGSVLLSSGPMGQMTFLMVFDTGVDVSVGKW